VIRDIGTSIYRLADSHVLIGVQQTAQGPQPRFTQIAGETAVVAYTDVDEAKADLPETHRLFSIQVAELLQQLPPHRDLAQQARDLPWLRRLWRTWYQAADADPKLLVVYDVDDPRAHGNAAADAVITAAREHEYPTPLLVMALDDLPADHREYLLNNTPPFYDRP